ncbi:MAG: 2-oxoacid:acceptor oxidoreductase subunit alpha, partial [Acidobacteria bacterium]|nr:2-oxoacid:acceptor oxidoreductase subunit alpha [Acidobacteriota bacterium]
GLHLSTFRTFPAEIKGGPCMMQLRVSERPIYHPGDLADALMAFNEEAIRRNWGSLREGGTLIYESGIEARLPQREGTQYYPVPLNHIATKVVGNRETKNMVALGVLIQLYRLPKEPIVKLLTERFKKRGQAVLERNLQGLEAGSRYVEEHPLPQLQHRISATNNPAKLIMTGNEASAIGTLAAGVQCFFGYPITPSSEIMEYMARHLPRTGGRFLQTEDEISAIAGVCGASWTGSRAMTATSGPGVSLMSEILGLLSMAELPAVIVNSQRGGPSTGLPTKTEQSDLLQAVYSSHGEAPRIVLAPSTVRECLEITALAFDLSEKYQMPAIVLLDQALSSRLETVDATVLANLRRIAPSKMPKESAAEYRRFRLTETGVSARAFPGTPGYEHVSTGLEHNERGDPQYDERMHTIMSAKRYKKLAALTQDPAVTGLGSFFGVEEAEIGIMAWGSTAGPVQEAVEQAIESGIPVKAMIPKLLYPLLHSELKPFLASTRRLIVPEMNFTGQLATLLRSTYRVQTLRLNKVKGVPFQASEILEKIQQVAEAPVAARLSSRQPVLEGAHMEQGS